jgi:predicted PurR-regulated permease PerM
MTNPLFFSKASYFLLFLVLSGFVLSYGAMIFIPVTFSLLMAFIVLPINKKMEQMGSPRWLGAFVGILFVSIAIGSIIGYLSYEISNLSENMPIIKAKLSDKFLEFQKYIRVNFGMTIREQNTWLDKQMKATGDSAGEYLMNFFSGTTTFITNLFLIPILAFFLLLYRDRFKTFLKLADDKYHSHTCYIIGQAGKVSQQYLKGVVIDICILTVLNGIGFWTLGLEYALLFAIMAAILNIVPYIGVLVGSIFPITMALISKDSAWYATGALGVCVVVQFLDNNFIGPKVIGSSVSVNPLFSTIALLIGALIWGMSGMILAMPLAGMLKVVFDNIPWLQPYGYLMGEEGNLQHQPLSFSQNLLTKFKILTSPKAK